MEHLIVSIDTFEGPFDLLYHLIEKNQMDIRDIPIAELTEQYMAHILAFDERDMDNMSEFLLMAATLLNIKCKMLLPQKEPETPEEDPRAELVLMLIEYKLFKEAAELFREQAVTAQFKLFRERDDAVFNALKPEPVFDSSSLDGLIAALEEAVKRRELTANSRAPGIGYINKDRYSLAQKIDDIRRTLKERGRFKLSELLRDTAYREEMAVIFQGVLQLAKEREITVTQKTLFGEIEISNGDYT